MDLQVADLCIELMPVLVADLDLAQMDTSEMYAARSAYRVAPSERRAGWFQSNRLAEWGRNGLIASNVARGNRTGEIEIHPSKAPRAWVQPGERGGQDMRAALGKVEVGQAERAAGGRPACRRSNPSGSGR
jgi:hypothetical protein